MYNHPKIYPIPPLYKKHLTKSKGVILPKVIKVAGRCPAAKSKLAIMFAITKTIGGIFATVFSELSIWESFDFFAKNIFQMINAKSDSTKSLSISSSQIPPYKILAKKAQTERPASVASLIWGIAFPKVQ